MILRNNKADTNKKISAIRSQRAVLERFNLNPRDFQFSKEILVFPNRNLPLVRKFAIFKFQFRTEAIDKNDY